MEGHIRKPVRSDTFDLRDQMQGDHRLNAANADASIDGDIFYQQQGDHEGEHSVLEDDSDEGEIHEDMDYEDDDGSSSLSIPNESIDFDLVYSLHSFAATVEGQANVVKGDSLILMDDSNSYWWLVRVLKTQEVGYIPAENIETPFERLARLNKHRNVDLAAPTQQEQIEGDAKDRLRMQNAPTFSRIGGLGRSTPSPLPVGRSTVQKEKKGVVFIPEQPVHRYPPFIWYPDEEDWDEDEEIEWDDEPYIREDADMVEDLRREEALKERMGGPMHLDTPPGPGPTLNVGPMSMEPDDGVAWDEGAARQQQAAQVAERQKQQQLQNQQIGAPAAGSINPYIQQQIAPQQQATDQQQRVASDPAAPEQAQPRLSVDPFETGETLKLSPTPIIVREAEADSPSIIRNQQQDALQRQQQDKKRRMDEEVESQKRARLSNSSGGKPVSAQPVSSSQPPPNQQIPQQQAQGRSVGNGKLRKEHSTGSVASKASSASGESTDEENGKKKKSGSFMGSLFGRGKKNKDRGSSIGSSAEGGFEGRGSLDTIHNRASVSADGHASGLMSPTTDLAMQQQQQKALQQQQQMGTAGPPPNPSRNSTDPKRSVTIEEEPLQQPQTQAPTQQQSQQLTQQQAQQQLGNGHPTQPSEHTSQLRQRDRDQQALYLQYLNRSPSTAPEPALNYGLQSASAVGKQYTHTSSSSTNSFTGLSPPHDAKRQRPGSLILSPSSPDGVGVVPDLSVIRVFAGSNLETEATFKTVLLNSSTTAGELVKQAIQRFRLPQAELVDESALSSYYLLAKQVEGGASLKLKGDERPLMVFEEMNKRASEEEEMVIPKVKRASVGSLSSLASNLSMHPAIEKLPMNDFTDDSAVKFYLNRIGGEEDDDEPEGWIHANDSYGVEGDDTLIAASSHEGEEDDVLAGTGKKYLSVHIGPPPNSNVTSERFTSPSFRFPLQLAIYPDELPDNMTFDPITEAIVFKDTLRERGDVGGSRTNSGVSLDMRKKVFVFPKNVTAAEVIEIGLERFGILEGVVDGGDEVEDKSSKRKSMSRVRYNLYVDIDGSERELSPTSKIIEAYPSPPTYKAVDRKFQDTKRRSVDSAMLLGNVEDVGEDDPIFVLRRATTYRSVRGGLSKGPLDELALSHLKRNSLSVDRDSHGSSDLVDSKNKILAQRKARSENQQKAILGSQTNSVRGVDVLLSGNVVVRSSRNDSAEQPRYSVVEPDGGEYDISRLVEEELRGGNPNMDLLEGMLGQKKEGMVQLERVLSKLKKDRTDGPLKRFEEEDRRSVTPQQMPREERRPDSRSNASTPTGRTTGTGPRHQPSNSSDLSTYATRTSQLPFEVGQKAPPPHSGRKLFLPKDDFGIKEMLAVIECRAMKPVVSLPRMDHVDSILFGRPLDSVTLHPDIKAIYSDAFKKLEECDKMLDDHLQMR